MSENEEDNDERNSDAKSELQPRHDAQLETFRDGFLPQLEPRRQTYSLGRCQMAFWFVLIFVAFVFLYIVLWDYNTVSEQAL